MSEISVVERGNGSGDGTGPEKGHGGRGFTTKGDSGKLQETLFEVCFLGRRTAGGGGYGSSNVVHRPVRNVLESCGRLTEEAFFLWFREGDSGRVTGVLQGFLRGDKTFFNQLIQAGIDSSHSVFRTDFHNPDNLFHPAQT